MNTILFTIGYEGLSASDFLRRLIACGIETLVDVRERPISRKRGFSKTALSESLKQVGIEYIHMKSLGCPTPIRYALRDDQNWDKYVGRFTSYMSHQVEAMQNLDALSRRSRCALLCFEAEPYRCHRSLIASSLHDRWNTDLAIIHITGDISATVRYTKLTRKATVAVAH